MLQMVDTVIRFLISREIRISNVDLSPPELIFGGFCMHIGMKGRGYLSDEIK